MRMVMCQSCGEFVQAFPDEDTVQPAKDECPNCGGTAYKDNHTGKTIETRGT